jgi:hypothetical protein
LGTRHRHDAAEFHFDLSFETFGKSGMHQASPITPPAATPVNRGDYREIRTRQTRDDRVKDRNPALELASGE